MQGCRERGMVTPPILEKRPIFSSGGYEKFGPSFKTFGPHTKTTTSTVKSSNTSEPQEMSEKVSSVNVNLETFLIVWLDANVNTTKDNEETYNELRSSFNYIKTFDDLSTCQEYIEGVKLEKIVLIVSGGYGKDIVPHIHNLAQVNCIYVYCADKGRHEEWARSYSKVQAVIIKRKKLIENIIEDQRIRNLTEDPVPMSILNQRAVSKEMTAKDISKEMGSILWFQLLVEVLLRMPNDANAKMELLQTWRENYIGNTSELDIIDQFEHQFKQSKAVWWYTRESSLYRILNKALREQSIDIIFAFRYFLTKLSKQVSKLYDNYMDNFKSDNIEDNGKRIIHVYRGQAITKEELAQMRASIDGFISINSFFSTSRSKTKARRFAKRSPVTEQLDRVLFRIKIDVCLPTKPFADIEGISSHPDEREILFMLGSIFRINDITYDENDALWILNLNLCSEDDFELKELFAYLKKDIGEETSMVTLGNILVQMGEYDKAERIFLRINHHEGLIAVEEHKGNFYLAMKNYKCAVGHYEQALNLRCKFFPTYHPDIGKSYGEIAMAFEFWKQYPKAIDYYQRTIEHYRFTLVDNHPLIIQAKNSLQKLQR
ncbi:unnamed protein product [Didymodactylos carnosus]|uniref:ADP ribosyltransferase domain-containing protein n=1 Tax=Didymodactylos carnosus TaxID=1234261 RepID=A0A8S2EGX0_9BILA|nr:unnamed protein product [Didymodactylos carnosus]CAF3973903.1 unnamed protein product [Didymodactylos carnosus]